MHYRFFASLIVQVIVLAGMYFILGIAGLELAVPPGYATAIFPAAGLAVAAIIYGGIRLLPGVWLGSFAINLWVTGSLDALTMQHVWIALLIAIGSSIQALIASHLVTFSQIKWQELTTLSDIALFLILTSPLACLVSSTWGNFTLYVFGIISSDQLASNWLNWWVGDATGVLLFAPITLLLLLRDQTFGKYRLKTVAIPTLITLTIAVIVFFHVSRNEHQQISSQLQNRGTLLNHHISTKLEGVVATVTSVANLMRVAPDISFDKFQEFTQNFYAIHPDLHGLSWNPYVVDADREGFEANLTRRLSQPSFDITQRNAQSKIVRAEQRAYYVPVSYITPFEINKGALGFDIASEPIRLDAIKRSLKTRRLATTSPINLVQETESSAATLLISPIYRNTNSIELANDSSDEILGFAVAVVRIENMMQHLFSEGLMEGIDVLLEDKHVSNNQATLFKTNQIAAFSANRYLWQADIEVGGRTWQLTIIPSAHYFDSHLSLMAWEILLIGLVFTGLLQILLLSLTGQHYLAKTALEQSESSLRSILDNAPFLIWQKDIHGRYLNINKKYADILKLTDISQIKGKTDFDIWPKEIAEGYLVDDAEVLSSQTTKHIEEEPIIDGQQIRYTETFKSPLLDPLGKLIGTIGFSHDISEKKQAREALKAKDASFQAMIETIPMAIYVSADEEQVASYINPTFTKLFGYTINEVSSAADWWPLAYPDEAYREQVSAEWQLKVKKAIETHSEIEPMETIVTCQDGSRKNILWGFTTLDDLNYAFGLNLTELREAESILFESEAKLKSLILNMNEGLALHELIYDDNNQPIDYRILEVTPAFEALTGIKSNLAKGGLATEIYGVNSAPYIDDYARVVKTGKPYHFDVYFEPLDRHFNISVFSPMENQFATVFTDITEREKIHQQLEDSESRFRELFEHTPIAYQSLNSEGEFIDVNQQLCDMLGYTQEDILHTKFHQLWMDDKRSECATRFNQFKNDGYISTELTLKKKDGQLITVLLNGRVQKDAKGDFVKTHCVLADITEHQKIAQEMRIAAIAFESQEGMFVTDANGNILRANQAFTEVTGYSIDEMIGKNPRLLSSNVHDARFYSMMWQTIHNKGAWKGEIWNKRKNGQIYPEQLTITAVKDDLQQITHYVATLTDITANKAAEKEIHSLAFYDPLTKLPNRRLFMDRLSQALASSARTKSKGALLFLDIDHFKTLNDTLGHEQGDQLLKQIANRLQDMVREHDTVARFGGDEFIVLLENLSNEQDVAIVDAKSVASKILSSLNQTYQLSDHEYHTSTSIGVIIFNDHDVSPETLIRHADIAMYQAKHNGRNAICIFDPQMQADINTRSTLERELRLAVNEQQFQLYYQVQVDNANQPLGAEVLIRWFHPDRGLISPMEFIPIAEETGLILAIGEWVLNSACAQLKLWQQQECMSHLVLSVNVSARQFHQADFVQKVTSAIEHYAINPQLLKLELTESMLLQNIDATIATMLSLKKLGVQFSLDDFGTGYSSLQYLKRLPLDQLKIDQSFVRDVVIDENDRTIVRTIIAMADNLALEIIAEGVETEEQRDILLMEGCAHYQGYLFSKPLPIDEFETWFKSHIDSHADSDV
ncbi:EAL domain-containing protein [Shewanella aestuarii]|uniref:cyclic-guanylate-specific phosphodiesterase n=1 Tax=Shewanella aestuarii TaxID=1028752 RepID=A0A6G9QND7_9GAMM|nr:EAL domain-containing protein [Shewanella aestuarii]QIR15567.1 EAL domain-containing protein [Shewanella aestuarii]